MVIFNALQTGIRRVLGLKPAALMFLLPNLLIALIGVLPFVGMLGGSLGTSRVSGELMKRFDILWLEDFVYEHGSALAAYIPLLVALAALYVLTDVFLVGGALGLINSEERFSTRRFLSQALANFSIIFRLTLLSFVFYALVLFLYSVAADSLTSDLPRTSPTEQPRVVTEWALYAGLLFFLLLVNMWFGYAKVLSVKERVGGAIKESWRALKFILHNKLRAAGLYFALLALQVVLTLAGLYLIGLLPQTSLLMIVFVFLIQEIFLLLRIVVRLTAYSSQTALCFLLHERREPVRADVGLATEQASTV